MSLKKIYNGEERRDGTDRKGDNNIIVIKKK